jgi:tetratricopeptide (TPR) repeat protein
MKILGVVVACLSGLAVAAFAVYLFLYYPRKIEPFEINRADLPTKVLIATQGSDFKNSLVATVCDKLEKYPAYVKVINVEGLDDVDAANWQNIIVMNTMMINKMSSHVERFVLQSGHLKNSLLLVTSGGFDYLPTNQTVDTITAASRKGDIDRLAILILDWTEKGSEPEWTPDDHLLALEFLCGIDVEATCETIKTDQKRYLDQYPDLESRINRIGYNYVRRGELRKALPIFRVNVRLFPESWNVYDSYAEALLKNGDRESAISHYRKSIELNPDNENLRRVEKILGEKL